MVWDPFTLQLVASAANTDAVILWRLCESRSGPLGAWMTATCARAGEGASRDSHARELRLYQHRDSLPVSSFKRFVLCVRRRREGEGLERLVDRLLRSEDEVIRTAAGHLRCVYVCVCDE
jgi:hypothetical protein